VKNNIVLSEEQILKNIREIQKNNNLSVSSKLERLNFNVEMGTSIMDKLNGKQPIEFI
jgi:type III restriction enzyme